jgi:hypothetical protein
MGSIYQEASANSYSFKQFEPLNPIMNYASILKQILIQLYSKKFEVSGQENENPSISQVERVNCNTLSKIIEKSSEVKLSLQKIISIEQGAKALWYFNMN